MKRLLYTALVLTGFWLLLSGHFSPLLLGFGIVCCGGVLWLCARMDLIDQDAHPLELRPVRLLGYYLWLLKEVVKSNISVARRILSPNLPIHPHLLSVPASQRTEIGQVIYANSITLTPGTVSIDLKDGIIQVHALAREPARELMDGVMDRKISAVERVPKTANESE